MRNGHTRYAVAALALAVFWILIYWSAPAARDGGVRIASAEEPGAVESRPTTQAPAPAPKSNDRLALQDSGAKRGGASPPPAIEAPLSALAQREPAPTETRAPEPRAGVVAPQFREHVVRPGQTMLSIAKEVFGESKRWEAISRANPKVDPLKLRAGTKLRIPHDPTNIQGAPLPAPAGGAETAQKPEGAKPSQYTVKSGDTLGGIALRTMGSAAAWEELLRANRAVLSEPEDLRPGMTLTIPAR